MDPDLIRSVRKAGRWNQKQFSRMLGVTVVTVCRWERGHASPLPVFRAKIEEIRRNLDRHGAETEYPA